MIPNGQGKSLKVELNRLKEHCKRTEKSYSDTEQRFRLATQATGLGIWEWNVLTDRTRWDQQMFCLYGIPPTHRRRIGELPRLESRRTAGGLACTGANAARYDPQQGAKLP